MSLNSNTGSIITKEEAQTLIAAFAKKFPGQIISSFIGENNVKQILEQDNCIGLRVYNGYDDAEKNISLVIVGVDDKQQDILDGNIIYDKMVTCPPICAHNGLV